MDGNAANFDQLPEPKWWCGYSVAVSLTLEIHAHLLARSAEPDSLERPSHSRTRRLIDCPFRSCVTDTFQRVTKR